MLMLASVTEVAEPCRTHCIDKFPASLGICGRHSSVNSLTLLTPLTLSPLPFTSATLPALGAGASEAVAGCELQAGRGALCSASNPWSGSHNSDPKVRLFEFADGSLTLFVTRDMHGTLLISCQSHWYIVDSFGRSWGQRPFLM